MPPSPPESQLEGRSTLRRTYTQHDLIKRYESLMKDNKGGIVDSPLRTIPDHELPGYLEPLKENCGDVVTPEELLRGAILAKMEHSLDVGADTDILTEPERRGLEIQRSSAFWREPKDLLLTLQACCLASMVQGWDQVANGNLGWKDEFNLYVDPQDPSQSGAWKFAAVQAVPWFTASILGSYLSDPLSEYVGRRGALFVAGWCSFASSVLGSRATSWKYLLGTRVLLGLGIGGKASIVPVLESEVLPPSKRGRLLVSWQVFTATGLFLGSIACYIFRNSWRNQILSGAIPAFALLMTTFSACESPRWLIIQGDYKKAFTTLERLRKSRVLAAKELVSIHYQIQAERSLFLRRQLDEETLKLNPFQRQIGRTTYWERLYNMFFFPRIRRAAIAAMVVMLSQQLSGINIYAFLATQFYSTAGPARSSENESLAQRQQNETDSFKFAIGFGVANMVFSTVAYFFVENKDPPADAHEMAVLEEKIDPPVIPPVMYGEPFRSRQDDEIAPEASASSQPSFKSAVEHSQQPTKPEQSVLDDHRSVASSISSFHEEDYQDYTEPTQLRGRRFLLLTSLGAGVITLALTSAMFHIPDGNPARLPLIILFIMIFTAVYSPGAGAIPFLYSAEIWPNEGRELGMSWSTFWNFLGSGLLALFVPFGINWGHAKLLGLFSGFSALAFILVFFLVPSTNHTATLEDMSYLFGRRMRDHARIQAKRLWPWSKGRVPKLTWSTANDGANAHSNADVNGTGTGTGTEAGDEKEQRERESGDATTSIKFTN